GLLEAWYVVSCTRHIPGSPDPTRKRLATQRRSEPRPQTPFEQPFRLPIHSGAFPGGVAPPLQGVAPPPATFVRGLRPEDHAASEVPCGASPGQLCPRRPRDAALTSDPRRATDLL